MRKFGTIGAACLAVVLAAASPAAAHTSRAAVLEVVDFMAVAAGSASDLELRLA
jgi:hypothetical protein